MKTAVTFCVAVVCLFGVVMTAQAEECQETEVTWLSGEQNLPCRGAWTYRVQEMCVYENDPRCGDCLQYRTCNIPIHVENQELGRVETGCGGSSTTACNRGYEYYAAQLFADPNVSNVELSCVGVDGYRCGSDYVFNIILAIIASYDYANYVEDPSCGCLTYPTCTRACDGIAEETRFASELGITRAQIDAEIAALPNHGLTLSPWCSTAEDLPADNAEEIQFKFQRVWDAYEDESLASQYGEDSFLDAHIVQMILLGEFYGGDLTQVQANWADFLSFTYAGELPCGE